MIDRHLLDGTRFALVRERGMRLYRSSPRLRRAILVLGSVLLVFGLLGFFAAPPLLKSQLQRRLGAELDRPVTIGEVRLNPFTLRLDLDRLRIGEPAGRSTLLDIDRLTVNASWSSLFRWAPVLDELSLQHPRLRITRFAPQRFNFSDLIARFAGKTDPKAPPSRFAIANISVQNGEIDFDDHVLKTSHHVDRLELHIPFLANMPADIKLFVTPLLAARIDGSPLRIDGKTKPFAGSRESEIDFQLDHLDLPRYLGYVPMPVPVAMPHGQLSGTLQLRFIADGSNATLRLDGQLALDDISLTGSQGAPLLELGHGSAQLADVQPLISRYHFGAVQLDRATVHYQRGADGHSNFDALTATGSGKVPTGSTAPATDLRIASLSLQQGRFDYADSASGADAPATLVLNQLHGTLRGLSTVSAPAGSLDLTAHLDGGSVSGNGTLDLAAGRFRGRLAMQGVALVPLQPLLLPQLQATIGHGRLDAGGQLQADWSRTFNLHLEPAQITVSDLSLQRKDGVIPVAWQSVQAKLASFDLADSEARIESLAAEGLKLDVKRLRDGRFDLANLIATPPGQRSTATPAATAWHWSLAHLDITNSDLAFRDLTARRSSPVALHVQQYVIDGLSDDLHRSLDVALSGRLGKGSYTMHGKVRPVPLDARLQVGTRGVDIAPLQSLISVPLNVRIGSALLSLDGGLRYSDRGRSAARIDYRGRATLGRVRVQDKLTGEDFLRWHSLTATRLSLRLGDGAPHVTVGGLALGDFYARLILNSNGRLNLQDVVANQAGAVPVSVTRAETQPTPAIKPMPASTPSGPRPEIAIGQISLTRGQLNYTDNFIKPNYSANITDLTGTIGAFGTREGPPAELVVQGKLDQKSPVDITGSINPLAPVAFLDVKGKADAVELDHLSPYSSKYAGYPITSGLLNVDVHYLLDQRKLTADNHLFVEQLTFGDRIDAPGVRHLPLKLAVALLKNSRGQIDVHVPVTGSLDDPKFSMGGLIWRAFANLIVRAATAPFRLLASIGGGHHPDLGYVEFAPGSAMLDSTAQSRLTQLVKLLDDKPSLRLDITGRVDPDVDEKGLRQVMVDDLIRKEKADHDGIKTDPSTLKLTPDEYQHYLTRVYRHAKFPKPKNLIGLTKSQPPDVMHQLLETHMPVDATALKQLAERRSEAVRRWLHGKVDEKRLVVHEPKLDAKGIDDKGRTTRVDFGLH
jgi:uncharacterized protein involved in outer membrane biogenesis